MPTTNKTVLFSVALIIVSLMSISIRSMLSDPESVPMGDSLWELHWEFEIDNSIVDAEIRLATPIDTQHTQVVEQNIALQGMRIVRNRVSKDGTRDIVSRISRLQNVGIDVNFVVRLSPPGIPHYIKTRDVLNSERRQLYTSANEILPSNEESVRELRDYFINNVKEPELMFNALFEYCTSKIKTDEQHSLDNVLEIINKRSGSVLGKVRLLTTLARAAKIPARIVMGLILEEESDAQPHYWMEINVKDQWLAYDPSEGYVKEMPLNYLPVRRNGESFMVLPAPMQLKQVHLEALQRDTTVEFVSQVDKRFSDILDLNRLTLSTQLTLAFLLLLPIGALFTVFVRQIIGPNVYGTFTPTFLALALTHVGWISASIILCIVTLVGILGRSFTSKLGLNRVSRLTIVFILVAISMIFSVSLMVYYGLAPDGSIVLLPIVILTFMIDRIYGLADSDGVKVAMIRLAWTVLVSAFVASILQMNILGLWLLRYPEAHLITAALVILISLYKSKKWMKKLGLEWLLEPKKAKITGKKELEETEIT